MTSSRCLAPQQAPRAGAPDDQEGQGQKRAEGGEREAERWRLPPPSSPVQPAAGLTNLTATRGNMHCPLSQERPACQPWLFYSFLFFYTRVYLGEGVHESSMQDLYSGFCGSSRARIRALKDGQVLCTEVGVPLCEGPRRGGPSPAGNPGELCDGRRGGSTP